MTGRPSREQQTVSRRMATFHERLGAHASLTVTADGPDIRFRAWLTWAAKGRVRESTGLAASPSEAFTVALDAAKVPEPGVVRGGAKR